MLTLKIGCSELVVCSCTQLYCCVCIWCCIYCLVRIVDQFPILSGMIELVRRTKLIFVDSLVPTTHFVSTLPFSPLSLTKCLFIHGPGCHHCSILMFQINLRLRGILYMHPTQHLCLIFLMCNICKNAITLNKWFKFYSIQNGGPLALKLVTNLSCWNWKRPNKQTFFVVNFEACICFVVQTISFGHRPNHKSLNNGTLYFPFVISLYIIEHCHPTHIISLSSRTCKLYFPPWIHS